MKFKNKVVLVTGSSRGIGAAIAKAFAKEGASIIVNYVQNEQAANEVVAQCISVGGDAFAIRADVTDKKDVKQMIDEIELEFGQLHAVVNNAFAPFQFDPENRKRYENILWNDYEHQLIGSLRAVHFVNQAAIPLLKKGGGGSIIQIITNLLSRPVVPYHEYTTAKGAVESYSKNLAAELGRERIRVNCIAPGLVYPTDASKYTRERVKEAIIAETPLCRLASPEDIAGPVLFLASEWSQFVTGQTLIVDGGFVMN